MFMYKGNVRVSNALLTLIQGYHYDNPWGQVVNGFTLSETPKGLKSYSGNPSVPKFLFIEGEDIPESLKRFYGIE